MMEDLTKLLSSSNSNSIHNSSLKNRKPSNKRKTIVVAVISVVTLLVGGFVIFKVIDGLENEKIRTEQQGKKQSKTDIVLRRDPSDGYHARARKSTESTLDEEVEDVDILNRQMKKLQWGFRKSTEGSLPPSDSVNIYFKGSSNQLFFDLTYPYQGQIDPTFLEMYKKEDSKEYYIIFRLIWDKEGYLYFMGETDGDYVKLLESFGDFPTYNSTGLGEKLEGSLSSNTDETGGIGEE